MVNIPQSLRNPELRFYLVAGESKIPLEKEWTTRNNYPFNSFKLIHHQGNYGVVCGIGNIVVLDFDDQEYFEEIKERLPDTFTVITAGKRLPHYYYYLDAPKGKEGLFKGEFLGKIGIDRNGKRVCDIQALGSGVVAPGSTFNRRYYEISKDREIAHISLDCLEKTFHLNEQQKQSKPQRTNVSKKVDTEKKDVAIAALHICGINIRSGEGNFQCPFHGMNGQGNLSIADNGKIHCFHCLQSFWADEFIAKVKKIVLIEAQRVIKLIELLYYEEKDKREKMKI